MTIAPEGLGIQINSVWMGSRDACGATLEAWVATAVVYTYSGGHLVYPLNLDQAIQMRDRLRALSLTTRPTTAGERYNASKAKLGLSFKFDHDADGIFLADQNASPALLGADAVGTISFKSFKLSGVDCIPLTAEHCAMFAKTLTEVLDRHSS